jgi:hypothetical protein
LGVATTNRGSAGEGEGNFPRPFLNANATDDEARSMIWSEVREAAPFGPCANAETSISGNEAIRRRIIREGFMFHLRLKAPESMGFYTFSSLFVSH